MKTHQNHSVLLLRKGYLSFRTFDLPARPSGLCGPHGALTLLTSLCPPAGDIGGQMGLFIGASILTVLELFDYAYEVSGGRGGGGLPGQGPWKERGSRPPTHPLATPHVPGH